MNWLRVVIRDGVWVRMHLISQPFADSRSHLHNPK